jgi:hypothetical protein
MLKAVAIFIVFGGVLGTPKGPDVTSDEILNNLSHLRVEQTTFAHEAGFGVYRQTVRSCTVRIGTGSCGGYNRDIQRNCPNCSTADTYRCTDGSTAEICTNDPKHCGC